MAGARDGDPVRAVLARLAGDGVARRGVSRGRRTIRWIEAGRGAPAIVVVPGAGEMALDWAHLLADLSRLSTVVLLDRAGLGASDPVRRPTLDGQVDDLVAVLVEIGPAVVVGHSWGGLLAQLAAARRPEVVAGLVLVDPTHEDISAAVPLAQRAAAAVMLRGIRVIHLLGLFGRLTRPMGEQTAARCTDDPQLRRELVEAYVGSYRRRWQVAAIGVDNRYAGAGTAELRRRRSPLPASPVVVLTATRGKPPALQQLAAERADEMVAAAPLARHVVVDDAGHYIHHDQPAAVLDAIGAVLADTRRA